MQQRYRGMMKKIFCMVWIVGLLAACGGGKAAPPEPAPAPTHVILDIEASEDINPDAEGRPSPVVLRIYELKSATVFNGTDFISLYEKDKNVLGGDLVRKDEVIVQPKEKKTIHFEASGDTRAIGIFAIFRKYDEGRWRAAVTVRPHDTMVATTVLIGGTAIGVK